MRTMRLVGLLLLTACGLDVTPGSTHAASTSGDGGLGDAGQLFPPAAIDLSNLQRVELLDSNCGAISTSCAHLESRIVDFGSGQFEHHVCLENAGSSAKWGAERGDRVETRALTASELAQVRQALAALRTKPAELTTPDGPMSSVLVTTATGSESFSPAATCGSQSYEQLVVGFGEFNAMMKQL